MNKADKKTSRQDQQQLQDLKLTTEFPLSEKDEVAEASNRTRLLYEARGKLKEMENRDAKGK